jgi:hypothetical protein
MQCMSTKLKRARHREHPRSRKRERPESSDESSAKRAKYERREHSTDHDDPVGIQEFRGAQIVQGPPQTPLELRGGMDRYNTPRSLPFRSPRVPMPTTRRVYNRVQSEDAPSEGP